MRRLRAATFAAGKVGFPGKIPVAPVEAGLRGRENLIRKGIALLPLLDYISFVHPTRRSHVILTGSGGVQEEAPSPGAPAPAARRAPSRPGARG